MADADSLTTDFVSDRLVLRLVAPPADLAPFVAGLYRMIVPPGASVEDWLPPEEANLRTGTATEYSAAIGDGEMADVPAAIISGPTDRVTHLRISEGSFWGMGLTPTGWAQLVDMPVDSCVNRFQDVRTAGIPDALCDMLDHLRDIGDDIVRAASLVNATLRRMLAQRPPADERILAIHRALLTDHESSVAAIAERHDMNARTFIRFSQKRFGFPPRILLRRQRFLRSLGKFMLDPSLSWINALDTAYWDQAHFIRDFRATMGMTPSDYARREHPIVAAAVAVTHRRSGITMQGLYDPARPIQSETGL
ncbi:helix-turn-helix domain-containing protein [Qipengyuania sp. XHP0207]|uniref:helix-turn-helix domain-containing protein n=1 Tax=Qipengyuania sp. XHP0207 TaxID=3038078 RepID=UPI00241F52C8|nr:helix-turn-helix domain-containing protein [Qipengyuania sp. XHP0207]MDG5748213.1 helix-turn-helix domain-containing protein [Qipengyuania sp. XHP0207]